MLTIKQQLEALTHGDRVDVGAKWITKLDRIEYRPITPPASIAERFKQVWGDSDEGYLQPFVDGKGINHEDGNTMLQGLAGYYAKTNGIRIIEVSEEEAELYSHTDLHAVDAREWRQSYPLLLVKVPTRYYHSLIGVMPLPHLKYYCNLFSYVRPPGSSETFFDHCAIARYFEEAFRRQMNPGEPENDLSPIANRIAVNAVLHLANYPDLYGRHSDRASTVIVKQRQSGLGTRKKFDLVPQIIKLRAPLVVHDGGGHHIGTCTGTGKRPHWRRGHWRRVRLGAGQELLNSIEGNERRHVWIKPVLVNAKLVGESKSQTSVFVG